MRRVFGPRTVVEAAFLVAVPVVALVAGLGKATIIAASAVGYLLVLVVEATLWREGLPSLLRRKPAAAAAPAPVEETVETVVVRPPEPAAAEPEPEPEPPAAPEPEPEPAPARTSEHVRVLRPEPPPSEPAPAPERPQLVTVPAAPEPEPEPEPLPEPEPAAATVVPIGVGAGPQRWNLWDLERLTREHSGADAARDEERTFLLMYLREFAGPDGLLPVDFDRLVRDSFGELVGAR
jgi:hypothetical protein